MNEINEITSIISKGSLEQLITLLDQSPQLVNQLLVSEQKKIPSTLLLLAITYNQTDKVALILERGCEPNNQPEHPISKLISSTIFADSPNKEILKLLIQHQMQFPHDHRNCKGFITDDLTSIYNHDNAEFLQLMLELGFNPVTTEQIATTSIIMQALTQRKGDSSAVADLLLDFGCYFNGTEINEPRPIVTAFNNKQYQFVTKLIDKGADIGRIQQHLLHNIAEEHPQIPEHLLNLLIGNESDFNEKDYDGDTPLHLACYANNINFIKYLINKGGDINALNHCDATPLCAAIQNNQTAAIQLLMEAGANLNLPNKKGRRPLDIALLFPSLKKISAALAKAGAKSSKEPSANVYTHNKIIPN